MSERDRIAQRIAAILSQLGPAMSGITARRAAAASPLRLVVGPPDDRRTSATGHADPAFKVRESLSTLDALDGIDDRLRGAAGVVALIADRSAAQGDTLTAGAASAVGADLAEAAELCRVLACGLARRDADAGGQPVTLGRTIPGDSFPNVELSAATVELLGRYLPAEAVGRLRQLPALLREGTIAFSPSRGQVRAAAQRIAKLSRALADALDTVGSGGWLLPGQDPSIRARLAAEHAGDAELRSELEALCGRMRFILDSTGDNPGIPQWPLPGARTRSYADPRVILVGDSVLLALHIEGVRITMGATSPSVRCVAAVFGDLGIHADPREFVRRQLRRYTGIFRGGVGATAPENGGSRH